MSAKLYAWQPRGHGQQSFFVAAETEADAREAVEKEISRLKRDCGWFREYDCLGWGTDYYELTALPLGRVLTNDND
jgi:hypothetical protein